MRHPTVSPGTFVVIHTNGEIETVRGKPTIKKVMQAIGCECLDSVNLRDGYVMMVDDAGYETQMINHGDGRLELRPIRANKPDNEIATEIYWAVCKPGTTHKIVGDVVLVRDSDFQS